MESLEAAEAGVAGAAAGAATAEPPAEPLAQPYLRLPGVYHVAGQQGALALMAGDGVSDPTAVAQISGQHWYSVLVFVVLMLLGGLGAALARGSARRSRGGAA